MNFLFGLREKVVVTSAWSSERRVGLVVARQDNIGGVYEYDILFDDDTYEWVEEPLLLKTDDKTVSKINPYVVLSAFGLVAEKMDGITEKVVLAPDLAAPICPGHPVNEFLAAADGKGFVDINDAALLLLDCLCTHYGRESFETAIIAHWPKSDAD